MSAYGASLNAKLMEPPKMDPEFLYASHMERYLPLFHGSG
jgi:hypothetical protein